jgi:hypothetical protein
MRAFIDRFPEWLWESRGRKIRRSLDYIVTQAQEFLEMKLLLFALITFPIAAISNHNDFISKSFQ